MNKPYTLLFILLLIFLSCKKNPDVIKKNPPAPKAPTLIENYTAYTWGDTVPVIADSTVTGNVSNTNVIIDDDITVQPTRINGDTIYFKVPNAVPYQYNKLVVAVAGKQSNESSLTLHLPQITSGGSLNLVHGSTLLINGQFFNPVLSNNRVTLGKLNLTVVSATPTQLVVKNDTATMSTSGWLYIYTGQGLSVTNAINYNYYRFLQPAGSFPGAPRLGGITATINGIVYFGLGLGAANGKPMYDWWKYDPTNSSWTAAANSPGTGSNLTSFIIGNKVYVLSDGYFWAYDSSSNTWTSVTTFPGGTLNGGTSFSSTQYGYIVCGQQQQPNALQLVNTTWRYDPQNNSWLQLANFPGQPRAGAEGTTLDGKAYMIGGYIQSANGYIREVWEFDLTNETWSQVTSLPSGAGSVGGILFTANNKIYFGGGTTDTPGGIGNVNTVYEYDPVEKSWALKEKILDNIYYGATATSVNNIGYILCGQGADAAYPQGFQYFFRFVP